MTQDSDGPGWIALRKTVFDSLMELTGRVFALVHYSPDVVIGRRGFLPEEKERGLILVFNSAMSVQWEDDVLCVRLVFGTTPEDCRIPLGRIVALYNPDHQVQFLLPPSDPDPESGSRTAGPAAGDDKKPHPPGPSPDKVVRVDFNRSRRRD